MSRLTATTRNLASNRFTIRDFGTSLIFNGSTAKVASMNVGFTRTSGQPLSVGIWFKTILTTSNITFISVRNGSAAGNLWKIGWGTAGQIQFSYDSTGGGGAAASSTKFNDGKWHHAVGVYDGTNITIYVDAVQVGQITNKLAAAINQTLLGIGFRPDTGAEFFKGNLDQAFISNQALSLAEIQDIYYKGKYPTSKLTNFWTFDEGSGTTAMDSIGSVHGTITAATYSTDVRMKPRQQR